MFTTHFHSQPWPTVSLLALATVFVAAATAETSLAETEADTLPDLTVTATRGISEIDDAAIPAWTFSAESLEATPFTTADDFLRQVPGFSLFRRTSSLAANPTTQGASLRGIGPSGTSRALVLYDGIPFNDAFGGWVYWSRLDLQNADRVEVVRGGGSAAWGNTALGGVIQIVPARPPEGLLETQAAFGSQGTRQGQIRGGFREGPLALAISARSFRTDGYTRVRRDQRGAVDIPTDARHQQVEVTGEYTFSGNAVLTVRGAYFDETRGNGTPLSNNATETASAHAKLEWSSEPENLWRADLYFTDNVYSNTFTSVADDRNSEQLVLDQFSVPSTSLGGALQQTRQVSDQLSLTLGGDFRRVEGETNERVVFQGANRVAGGEQILPGILAEGDWRPQEDWRVQVGARADYWVNRRGFLEQPNAAREFFPSRNELLYNTRLGVSHRPHEHVLLRAAAYQAFRAPTINELYRPFQVGADVTLANAELDPERLTGVEFGIDLSADAGWFFNSTAFLNRVRDPILNATIGVSPQGGQLRQRSNIDRTEIRGIETEIGHRFGEDWAVFANHAWIDATVRRAAILPELEGRRLAQVPRHTAAAGVRLDPGEQPFGFSAQARWVSAQFEDDLNTRRMGGYLTVDMTLRYQISAATELFASGDNLLDRRYVDGITGAGLVTEGAPRRLMLGARHTF